MNQTFSDREMREGQERLSAFKDRFKGLPRDTDSRTGGASVLGASVISRLRPEHFHAVVVYQRSRGWYADVLFSGLPSGIPDVMGTPVDMPLASREEAEAQAWEVFRMMMQEAKDNEVASRDTAPEDVRPFELHGCTFTLPGPMLDALSIAIAHSYEGSVPVRTPAGMEVVSSVKEAEKLLGDRVRGMMGGEGFDPDVWNAAPDKDKMEVVYLMAVTMVFGSSRFPSRSIEPSSEVSPRPD